jgi:glycosyltransferase involved in cell wall biosynthesis
MLRSLTSGYAVDLLTSERVGGPPNARYEGDLRAIGVELLPSGSHSFEAALARRRYQVVLFEFYYAAVNKIPMVRRAQPWAGVIVDSVDVHYVRERMGQVVGAPGCADPEHTRELELAVYREADAVVVVSPEDGRALRSEFSAPPTFLVPNIVPVRARCGVPDTNSLLFIGGFLHFPNVDGIEWFVRDVWPRVRSEFPTAVLSVIGSNPTESVLALGRVEGVRVLGFVPDVTEHLERAAISVAPLRYGAGMKGKVNEALAWGIPVVTTSTGAQGFPVVSGTDLFVADSAEEFARCVVQLLRDPDLRARIGASGQRVVAAACSAEAALAELRSMFAVVGGARSVPRASPPWLVYSLVHHAKSVARAVLRRN